MHVIRWARQGAQGTGQDLGIIWLALPRKHFLGLAGFRFAFSPSSHPSTQAQMVSSIPPYYDVTGDATKNTSDSCTAQAHRILTQVFVTGARVFGRAFAEAYKQASASQVTHPLRLPSTTTFAKYSSSEIRPKPPKKPNSSQHPLRLRPDPRRSLPHP